MPVPLPPDDPRFKQRVENTFRLDPEASERFRCGHAKDLVQARLTEALQGVQYDVEQARSLAVSIANNIRLDLEQLYLPRYKLVAHVLISERRDQGLAVGCRFLWDDAKDNFATATFENQTLVAVAAVFGTYCE
ncbi:dynein light chain Tctex-type 5-like [Amphibalanus amphitrite]|uniref:dynein light chain Tctex-type 5-like n=1 Tax=Amphibalanus amphitrite TaxID=1232801 RepID=UPI001C922BB0|nr:dynein light chain Tctex-type 5-like [Amphibalanus amphitrite]